MLCLVIEASAAGGELPDFTRQHPGSTIELMAEPTGQGHGDDITALVLVRGAPWQDIDRFVAELGQKQGPVDFEVDTQVGLHRGCPFSQHVAHDHLSWVRERVVRSAAAGYRRLLQ